jgi:hypothetical protein
MCGTPLVVRLIVATGPVAGAVILLGGGSVTGGGGLPAPSSLSLEHAEKNSIAANGATRWRSARFEDPRDRE